MSYFLLAALNLVFLPAAAAYLLWFLVSPRRALLKELAGELKERVALYSARPDFKGCLWIHGASVGEIKSAALLAQKLRAQNPALKILVTASTSAGREAARAFADEAVLAPLDFYPFCSDFMAAFRPSRLLVIETELWPNMFVCAGRNGADISIVNGRLSEKSARLYGFIRPLVSLMGEHVSLVCAQTERDAARYRGLGFGGVTVSGNIKYDLLQSRPDNVSRAGEMMAWLGWGGAKILVCGSVHQEEERLFVPMIQALKSSVPGFRLVIAQRHLERGPALAALLAENRVNYTLLGDCLAGSHCAMCDCLVLDEMGWLPAFYAAGTAVFVGGTIAPRGGHNLLEAAITGRPVLFGESVHNTPEAAAALLKSGGGLQITPQDAAVKIAALLGDPAALSAAGAAAQSAAETFRGATIAVAAALAAQKA
ncbi:MAG: glycosyltransferase N-terminal domain-containing protein [Elusimicrobiales bacterium]